jgi:DNA polymerase III delta prime subunit
MIKKVCVFVLLIVLFAGCGYKPSAHYAKERIKGNVFVDLDVSIEDPKNSVLIKDSMSEILVSRLGAKLVYNKDIADTILNLKLSGVSLQVLQYDALGYEKLYRATVSIRVEYITEGKKGNIRVSGTYDFAIDGVNQISETKRFEAIKNASSKALEEIISRLAIESFKKEPKKEELEEEENEEGLIKLQKKTKDTNEDEQDNMLR